MKRLTGLFFLTIFCIRLSAQRVPDLSRLSTAEKLEQWSAYCNTLLNSNTNDQAGYRLIVEAAKKGLSFCPPDRPQYRSVFLYYAGYGYESQIRYDSAVYYYEQSELWAKKGNSLTDMVNAMMRLNYMYFASGKPALHDELVKRIKRVLDTTKNLSALAILNGSLGEYYQGRSEYEKFIRYKITAINFRKQLLVQKEDPSNVENIGVSYLQIAGTYLKIGQPAKAIEYLGYSKEYVNTYREGKAFFYNDYIDAYLKLDQPDSAAAYYGQLYRMMAGGDTLYLNLSYANRCFAEYHLQRSETDVAFRYANHAYVLAYKSGDEEILAEANTILGKTLYEKKLYYEAIRYLSAAAVNAYSFDKEMYAVVNGKLAQSYAALQKWKEAYAYNDIYSRLHDTLMAEAASKVLAETEARYQNKEKQQQIDTQHRQLTESRRQQLWLISGLLLLGLIALLLVIIYRNKKRTADLLDEKNKKLAWLNNDLEQANKTKAKLFSIISHDLRSPISQVYQFLKLQQNNPKLLTEVQRQELSHKIQTATGSLLETMEDLLLWSKTQMNVFTTAPQPVAVAAVADSCRGLLQLNSDAKGVSILNNIPAAALIYTDPYYLQTILRNLLQNAIKASPENGVINIAYEQQQQAAVLIISNEGATFSQQQFEAALADHDNRKTLNGLGLRLVAELVQKLNGIIRFDSNRQEGTAVRLILAL